MIWEMVSQGRWSQIDRWSAGAISTAIQAGQTVASVVVHAILGYRMVLPDAPLWTKFRTVFVFLR